MAFELVYLLFQFLNFLGYFLTRAVKKAGFGGKLRTPNGGKCFILIKVDYLLGNTR